MDRFVSQIYIPPVPKERPNEFVEHFMDLQGVTVIGVIPGDEISKIKGYRQVKSFCY